MQKRKILRICHKYLMSNDGYDLDIQDIAVSLKDYFENYITFFITKEDFQEYIRKNNLIKKENMYYHQKTTSFLIPIFYEKKYNDYVADLYLFRNIISFYKQYKQIYQTVNPHIIHIHGTLAIQFFIAAVLGKRKMKKIIATHHIGFVNENYYHQKSWILLFKSIIHNLFPFVCDKIICVSNHSKKSFIINSNNIIVINPIPLIRDKIMEVTIDTNIKNNILNNKFELRKQDFLYFYPARFCEQKNQLNLMKAFEQLLEEEKINVTKIKNKKINKLILIGKIKENNYFKQIQKFVKESKNRDNYCIINESSNENIASLLERTNAFTSPSYNEGFGRAAMEAVMQGIPVLASNEGGYKDFIKNKINGILIDPKNINQIKIGLEEIRKIRCEVKFINKKEQHDKYIILLKQIYNK